MYSERYGRHHPNRWLFSIIESSSMSGKYNYRHGLENNFYQSSKFYQLFVLTPTIHICKQKTCCTVTAIQYGRRNCLAEYHLSVHCISYDATRCQEIANKAATEQNAWTAHLPNIWHCVGTDYLTYRTQVHCIHNGFRTGIGLWHSVISTHIQAPDIMIHRLT